MDVVCAEDEVDVGQFLEKGVLFRVRHAPCDADELFLLHGASELPDFSHGFPFSEVSDGTGIKKEEVGAGFVFDALEASVFELADHDFAVQLVHLATVGFYKESFWVLHDVAVVLLS